MSKKQIIAQAVIVLSLLAMIVISLTTAWFTASTVTEVEDTVIEVSSSNTFDMSLDGYNFTRDLKIKFYDTTTKSNLNTLLKDLCPVITTTGEHQQLSLYNPVKNDYTGEPDLNAEWTQGVKTNLMYDESTKYYYVINPSTSPAEYIEFDIWIRSDSKLDIYLGNESYLKPVNADKPMYSITEKYEDLYYTIYQDPIDTTETEIKVTTLVTPSTATTHYVYKKVDSDYVYQGYRKTITGDTPTYEYYDETNTLYESDDTDLTTFINLCGLIDSNNIPSFTPVNVGDTNPYQTHQEAQTIIHYYDYENHLVGITVKKGSTINNFDGVEIDLDHNITSEDYNYLKGTPTSTDDNHYSVEMISPYSNKEYTYEGKVLKLTTTYNFSKNLAASAMRVAFAEVEMTKNDGIYSDTGEILRYVWNPIPQFKLNNSPSGAYIEYLSNSNESTYFYTTKTGGGYNDKEAMNSTQVLKGNVQTTEDAVATGEILLCSTDKPTTSSEFSMKKVRVRVYVDGTDNESQNPLLSSSENGNAMVHMKLQLVSYFDNVIVEEVTNKVTSRANNERYFIAKMTDDNTHTFTYSRNTNIICPSDPEMLNIDIDNDGNDEEVAKYVIAKPGVLVVYATDDASGRVGALTVAINEISCVMTPIYGTDGEGKLKTTTDTYSLTFYENGAIVNDIITYSTDTINDIVDGLDSNNHKTYTVTFAIKGTYYLTCWTTTGCGFIKLYYGG